MSRWEKLLDRMRHNPRAVSYAELAGILEAQPESGLFPAN
jgi:hypothetical protein